MYQQHIQGRQDHKAALNKTIKKQKKQKQEMHRVIVVHVHTWSMSVKD